MDSTNKWFKYLHKERKLSLAVIQRAGLKESKDGWLQIPIKDKNNNIIFSKYRRPPEANPTLPKYTYDAGAKAALYGVESIISTSKIYITEGELDALAIRTCGEEAVSSTGGAMTFHEHWLCEFSNQRIVIMMDNDETGIKAAIKLIKLFRNVEYRWVPPKYGKDISDVLSQYGMKKAYEILTSDENKIDMEVPPIEGVNDKKQLRKKLNEILRSTPSSIGAEMLRQFVVELTLDINSTSKKKKSKHIATGGDELTRAKNYPIKDLIDVKRHKAICPFHDERTPSLHVYNNNTAFCFGQCQRKFDAIDIAMVKYNLSFKEALAKLSQ